VETSEMRPLCTGHCATQSDAPLTNGHRPDKTGRQRRKLVRNRHI
jgi:ribosomal protein S6E (S10)